MANDKEILISIKVDNEAAQKSITEQTKNITKLQDANKKLKTTNKELEKSGKDTTAQRAKNSEEIAKNNLKISEANTIRKNSITTLKQEANSLGAVKASLRRAGLARDKVNLSTKEGQIRFKELQREINGYNTTLKRAEAQGNSFKRNVGNYTNGIREATGSIGGFNLALLASPVGLITAALAGLVAIGRQAFNFFKEYEVIMSKVKATTGATTEEFDKLKESTIQFGESTKFTAREVGQLQLELSKLGFTTTEIIEATSAILDLAVATDTELGEAAKVVAKTLNQFGLEASESTRIADVMAKSFTTTALDIEVFSEGMKNAGVASKLVGVDIEQTTAILGVLADNGVDASTAGTQLKNVFIELSDQGLSWDDAMNKINKSQNKLQTANDLFGKRAAIVSSIIAENGDRINDLSTAYQNATGSAKEMADIVGNNLQGDLDRLGSSWEGLIARGSGLNKTFRVIVSTITFVIDAVKQLGTDTLLLFSPAGLIFVAIKRFGGEIHIFFNNIILDSFKLLQDGAAKLGLSIDKINEVITNTTAQNAAIRKRIAEEETKQGKTAYEKYKKTLTDIFNESENEQTAVFSKGNKDRKTISNLETKKDEEKAKADAQKKLDFQKQQTFELELLRKQFDAEHLEDAKAKEAKLIEIEIFKRNHLLSNEKLIETEREVIIENSENNIHIIKQGFRDEEEKDKEDQADKENKITENKIKQDLKNEEDAAKKKIALDKKVYSAKITLLNSGFALAKAIAGEDEKLQKGIAVGQAISNTAVGITKAFATYGPTPLGYLGAASIAATGAAQLITIANSDSGSNSGGLINNDENLSTNITADTSGADNALTQQQALEAAISNLGLTVSVTEINEAQSNVELSEVNSSIGG